MILINLPSDKFTLRKFSSKKLVQDFTKQSKPEFQNYSRHTKLNNEIVYLLRFERVLTGLVNNEATKNLKSKVSSF